MQLVIGNKNYSSWSMRPWVLMRQLGLPFEEIKLRFDFTPGSGYRKTVARLSPSGLVPALIDGDLTLWDTLAIAEYLHDKFPQAGVWPAAQRDRALARCIAAEMHSGFSHLRHHCGMNIEAELAEVGTNVWAQQSGVRSDMARIDAIWGEALARSGGPFLFGAFSAADAMYAPVCTRVRTYGLPASEVSAAYVQHVLAAPGVAAWVADALAEHDFLDFEEMYRSSR